jgi:hypothetical protein
MSGGVFICYRREETAFAARAIHDRVVQRLERENVFLDVDNIDLGVDWFNVLTDRVGACDALVAVIGRNWVSSADKDGLRRLDDPDDFVRIEIEAALKRDVRVIPILVDGASMPKASELPESLKGLARRQGTEISHTSFESDVEKLTRALLSILEARRSRDAAEADRMRQEREQQEAAKAARTEEAPRLVEVETALDKATTDRAAAQVEAVRRLQEQARAEAIARAEQATRLWDVRGAKPTFIALEGHRDAVTRAWFSADGTQVVTASHDKTARVWDLRRGKPNFIALNHKDVVISASFSPDGTHVVTASCENTARVWDLRQKQPARVWNVWQQQPSFIALEGHQDIVGGVQSGRDACGHHVQ